MGKYTMIDKMVLPDDVLAMRQVLALRNRVMGSKRNREYDLKAVLADFADNECVVYGTFIGGYLVAEVFLKKLTTPNEKENVLLIDRVIVLPEVRRRGLATQLIHFVLSDIKKINEYFGCTFDRVVLVPSVDYEESLFRKFGFETTSDSEFREDTLERKL